MADPVLRLGIDARGMRSGSQQGVRSLESIRRSARTTTGQLDRTQRGSNNVGSAFRELSGRGRTLTTTFRRLTGILGGLTALFAGGRLLGGLISTNREFERLNAQLQTVQGSAQAGRAAFLAIEQFAIATPFEVTNLTAAFVTLRTLGVQPTEAELTALGDLASSFTRDITDVADAVRSAAAGMTLPIRQLGFQTEIMGDQIRLSFGGSSRVVARSASAITTAIQELVSGPLGGAMAREMDTVNGAASNMADTLGRAARLIGEGGLNTEIKNLIGRFDELISSLTNTEEKADQFAQSVQRNIGVAKLLGNALTLIPLGLISLAQVVGTVIPALVGQGLRSLEAVFNSFAEHINQVPGIDIPTLQSSFVEGLAERTDASFREAFDRVRNNVGRINDAIAQIGGADTAAFDRIEPSLEGGAAAAADLAMQAEAAIKSVQPLIDAFEQLQRVSAATAEFELLVAPAGVQTQINELVKLRDQIDDVRKALQLVPATAPEFAKLTAVFADLTARAARLERSITEAIGDLPARLAALGSIAPALAPISNLTTQIDNVAVSLGLVQEAAQSAARASAQLGLARIAGDPERIVAAEDQLAAARDRLRDRTEALVGALDRANVSGERQRQVFDQLREVYSAAGEDMDDLTESTTTMATALSIVETSGRGILSVADSIDAIDDSTRRALTGILDVVRGLQQLKAAGALEGIAATLGTISGIGAAIGGLVSIGSSLFGQSEQDRARERVLDANTQALERLTREVEGFRVSADVLFDAQRTLVALQGRGRPSGFRELNEFLAETLGTAIDLRGLAEEFGIALFDEEGRLVAAALDQLLDAVQRATEGMTGFTDTLGGLQRERELRDSILGVDRTSQQQIEALFGDVGTLAPDLFREFLRGVDTSDTDAVRSALTSMLDAFATGGDQFAELMGNLTRDEFLSWLDSAAGALEELTEATRSLASIQQERSLRERITGVERTAEQEFAALVNDLGQIAPDLANRFFAGLDVSNVDAVQDALLRAFDSVTAGAGDLGDLARDDFLNWLGQATGALEQMRDVVAATTDATRNVPEWFRLAGAVLDAAQPDPIQRVLPPTLIEPFPTEPVVPPAPPIRHPVTPPPFGGPRRGRPITEPAPPGFGDIHIGSINITPRPGEDGEAVARRTAQLVKEEFQRENLARTGRRQGAFVL